MAEINHNKTINVFITSQVTRLLYQYKNDQNFLNSFRLIYARKPFMRHRQEAESLLRQLPFPACFELIDDDKCSEEEEKEDEENDMIQDLVDAYKLEIAEFQKNIGDNNDDKLERYMAQLGCFKPDKK